MNTSITIDVEKLLREGKTAEEIMDIFGDTVDKAAEKVRKEEAAEAAKKAKEEEYNRFMEVTTDSVVKLIQSKNPKADEENIKKSFKKFVELYTEKGWNTIDFDFDEGYGFANILKLW